MNLKGQPTLRTIALIFTGVGILVAVSGLRPLRFYREIPNSDPTTLDRQKYERTFIDEGFKRPRVWLPSNPPQPETELEKPEIKGQHALFIDNHSGNILFERESKKQVPVASLVKIMTAIIALEHATPDETFEISERAANIGENFMGISAGEKYTLEELLHGLILPSGNDAAEAIAEGVAGNRNTFINWMNFKVQELGLEDTRFTNPSGLEDGESQYSTAYDMIIIAHYAWENFPLLREIMSTSEYELPHTESHKALYFGNQTNLLGTYPGVAGMKTGYTQEAGLCLVTVAENDEKGVLGVVLNSTDRRGDAILLYDYSFAVLGISIEHDLVR